VASQFGGRCKEAPTNNSTNRGIPAHSDVSTKTPCVHWGTVLFIVGAVQTLRFGPRAPDLCWQQAWCVSLQHASKRAVVPEERYYCIFQCTPQHKASRGLPSVDKDEGLQRIPSPWLLLPKVLLERCFWSIAHLPFVAFVGCVGRLG